MNSQYFVYYLTGKCNLDCDYCNISKTDETMVKSKNPIEKFEKALKERNERYPNIPIKQILLSGGEPTLYPDILHDILSKYSDKYNITIISNGTRLGIIKELLKYNVNFIISYDGSVNDRGYNSIDTIKYLYDLNRLISISMVVGNKNYSTIYQTVCDLKEIVPRLFRKQVLGIDPYPPIQINIARCKPSYYDMNMEVLKENLVLLYDTFIDKINLDMFSSSDNHICENFFSFKENIQCNHSEGKLLEYGCYTNVNNLEKTLEIYDKKCSKCEYSVCYFKSCPVNLEEFKIDIDSVHPLCEISKILHEIKLYYENMEAVKEHLISSDEIELVLTDSCNLNCTYCFQKGQHSSNVMTKEVIDAVFSKIIDLPSDHITNKTLNLFGGEPILPRTLEIRNYILEYLKKPKYMNKINIAVTSNTYSLTEKDKEWLREIKKYARYVFWQVSIDSVKEIHDKQRITHAGTGTFDTVISNLKEVSKIIGKEFLSINSVITSESVKRIGDWCVFINDELYNKYITRMMFRIDQSRDSELTLEEKLNFSIGYRDVIDKFNKGLIDHNIVKYVFNVKRYMYDENLISDKDQFSSCGMCNNFVLINHNGDILPCHSFMNLNDNSIDTWIGNICTGKISNKASDMYDLYGSITDQFSELTGLKCSECKYKMECVRCKADHYKVHGNISKVLNYTCDVTRFRGDIYREELYDLFKPLTNNESSELMKDLNELKELYEETNDNNILDTIYQMSDLVKVKTWSI